MGISCCFGSQLLYVVTARLESSCDVALYEESVGDVVKVLYLERNDEKTFTIVSDKDMPIFEGTTMAPIASPLGQALEDYEEGDETSFLLQQRQVHLRILSITKPNKD